MEDKEGSQSKENKGARVFVENNKIKNEGEWWFWDEKRKTLRDKMGKIKENGVVKNSEKGKKE